MRTPCRKRVDRATSASAASRNRNTSSRELKPKWHYHVRLNTVTDQQTGAKLEPERRAVGGHSRPSERQTPSEKPKRYCAMNRAWSPPTPSRISLPAVTTETVGSRSQQASVIHGRPPAWLSGSWRRTPRQIHMQHT